MIVQREGRYFSALQTTLPTALCLAGKTTESRSLCSSAIIGKVIDNRP